ncbi:hypothetical protein MVES1_001713 [Malassezia vespertilionis]|uniref:Uncharacterized protein n=1 Tax=Malassezia vespertilionis TaxID=2020962 RepID=A0A2N1JCR8_9BASI|nr:uncharacterized protein MVES1_001713 [Malassezia vespertilionis]PKI84360.1 hypothetical protein MVES_001612 [Malassezia vespertilionis]WFD06368.1 hypothetical protein MVES1_001713 [Malassezia vespertilionis]
MLEAASVRSGLRAAAPRSRHVTLFSPTHVSQARLTLPEHEYQVRVGAVVRHLRKTLPQFMECGLLEGTRNDAAHPAQLRPMISQPLSPNVTPDRIYHEQIHFCFSPPLPPLPPLPLREESASKVNVPEHFSPAFSLHGHRMYMLSAQALRWSLHALFKDAEVRVEHMSFVPRRTQLNAAVLSRSKALVPMDELIARIRFRGTTRVSHAVQDYTMLFRYRLDRTSGTICEHHVDQMMPVPGSQVWQGLANMRSKLA